MSKCKRGSFSAKVISAQLARNSYARQQFVDVINYFPDEVDHILERYGQIWSYEHQVLEQKLSANQRLDYHQTHSLLVMAEIKRWGEPHLASKTIEAMLKIVVQDRGNAMFDKVLPGETIGDVITSMIAIGSDSERQ